jgi:uncharacterized membrane protein
VRRPSVSDLAAAGLVVAAATLYTWINLDGLAAFEPLEWDLSIFAQGTWKLGHGETPFVTIRGLHLFGDHSSYVHLLLAPFLRLWPSVSVLVVAQSLALAASAFLLFRVARERLGGGAAAPLVLVAYLLYPPLQHSWFEYYQPDALAIPCLIAAWWAVERRQARAALVWTAAALITKENVAATTFALGLYALVTRKRRIGLGLMAASASYLAVLMTVLFPAFNPGEGYVYSSRLYSDFASDLPAAVAWLSDPRHLWQRLSTPENARYLADLLLPVAALPIGAPLVLLSGVQLPLNLVSSWPYARSVQYHYTLLVVPFVFLALVAALARLKARSFGVGFACGLLAAATALSQYAWSPLGPALEAARARRTPAALAERAALEALVTSIHRGASVSADYRFLPRLCLRDRVFMFPELGTLDDPVEAVVLDLQRAHDSPRQEAAVLLLASSGRFELVRRVDRRAVLFLLKRPARPTGTGPAPAR